ncbi:MAG: dihydrofolate reductase [Solirubrobacterales bacterium]|nr:dihydrofolate reductase [Solirubrobacterales bacterium]
MAANVYYAAATLDGYIAEPEEKLEWLTGFEPAGYAGDAGAALDSIPAFIETVGALVMGSKTYEFIREHGSWSYGDRPSWVLTRRELEPMEAATGLRFASGDVAELDEEIRAAAGKRDVWLVDGGDVASQLSRGPLSVSSVSSPNAGGALTRRVAEVSSAPQMQMPDMPDPGACALPGRA